MAGTIVAGTLSDGTYSGSVTDTVRGACKAWVNFNGTGTVAIRAAYNVSSITDNGTGDYTINFSTAMIDSNYAPAYGCGTFNAGGSWDYPAGGFIALTTSLRIKIYNTDNTSPVDSDMATATIFR